jgi:pimeloyl-ACP methyl ester carboxylesterase
VSLPKHLQDKLNEFDSVAINPLEAKEDLKAIIPRHLRKPWRLLHLANTGTYEQHLKAVRELVKLNLTEGEFCQLAQSCERKTAVGLARSAGVDLRFFVKPPPLPPSVEETTIVALFRDILTSVPSSSPEIHKCIEFFTTTALDQYVEGADDESLWDSDISFEFHRESHHIHSIPYRPQISQETLIEHCLQALLSHSTVESHCKHLLQACPLFSKILKNHPENPRIKSLIGKILANICLHEEHHDFLFRTGWVGVLAAWKQDPNLLISLPAIKALCNLDQDFGVHKYDAGIYLLLPSDRHIQHKNNLSNWGVDVVFLHGLLGGVFYTWRQQDHDDQRGASNFQVSEDDYSYCWPRDWLQDVSDNVRVIGVDFDSYLSQWGGSCPSQSFKSTIEERSEDLLHKLRSAGVGKRPVVFVGHSMGGLLIKKMLVHANESEDEDMKQLAENTKGVVFYSTPHEGSAIAQMNSLVQYFFFPSVEVQELKFKNPALIELNQSFKEFVDRFKTHVISFGETAPTRHMGVDLTFVPPESSNPGYGEFYSVPFNHMDICKPENKNSILFRKFYNLVWDALDDASPYAA